MSIRTPTPEEVGAWIERHGWRHDPARVNKYLPGLWKTYVRKEDGDEEDSIDVPQLRDALDYTRVVRGLIDDLAGWRKATVEEIHCEMIGEPTRAQAMEGLQTNESRGSVVFDCASVMDEARLAFQALREEWAMEPEEGILHRDKCLGIIGHIPERLSVVSKAAWAEESCRLAVAPALLKVCQEALAEFQCQAETRPSATLTCHINQLRAAVRLAGGKP